MQDTESPWPSSAPINGFAKTLSSFVAFIALTYSRFTSKGCNSGSKFRVILWMSFFVSRIWSEGSRCNIFTRTIFKKSWWFCSNYKCHKWKIKSKSMLNTAVCTWNEMFCFGLTGSLPWKEVSSKDLLFLRNV